MGGGPPRIAMFGNFGVGNTGNRVSLLAGIAEVRRRIPDAEIVVVCPVPEVIERENSERAVSITMAGPLGRVDAWPRLARLLLAPVVEPVRWAVTLRFLRTVDAVIVPGTGILDDFGTAPHQMPYDLFRWSTVARIARRPWGMVSIGAGPIEHPVSRWLMRRTARNSRWLTYRDESSRAFMASIGEPAPANSVRPDLAFTSPLPDATRTDPDRTRIGVGIMAYYGWRCDPVGGAGTFERYIDTMVEITRRLFAAGYRVRLLVGDVSDDAAVSQFLARLEAALGRPPGDELDVPPITRFADLLHQVAETDAVIATRYHNVVAGLMLSRPTIALGYAPKFVDVMASCGLGDHCQDIETIDVDAVMADLAALLERSDAIAAQLGAYRRQHRDRASAVFDEIVAALPGARPSMAATDTTPETKEAG